MRMALWRTWRWIRHAAGWPARSAAHVARFLIDRLRQWNLWRNRWFVRLSNVWMPLFVWWRSRKTRYFLVGLPAVVVAAGVVTVSVLGYLTRTSNILPKYERALDSASRVQDHRSVLMLSNRILQTTPNRPDIRYRLALALDRLGQRRHAEVMMHSLAPEDKQGYYKAHYAIAARLLASGNSTLLHDRAVVHLYRATRDETQPNLGHAFVLLGSILQQRGRFVMAEKYYKKAVSTDEKWRFQLATLYRSWSKALRATEPKRAAELAELSANEAELVQSTYVKRLNADPADHSARRQLSAALMLRDRHQLAINVLRDGEALFPGRHSRRYRLLIAQAYFHWSQYLAKQTEQNVARRLQLLQRSLSYDPGYGPALFQLVQLSRLEGEEAAAARKTLTKILAEGKAPPETVHFNLGLNAWQSGDLEKARFHWEQALQLGGAELANVANNLAWLLAHQEKPEYDKAILLIGHCVAKWPARSQFRLTRARIYLRMKEWKKALSDLELALRMRAPGREQIHRDLALVYTELGDAELASKHAGVADEMKAHREKQETGGSK